MAGTRPSAEGAAAPPADEAGPSGRSAVTAAAETAAVVAPTSKEKATRLLLMPSIASEEGVGDDVIDQMRGMRDALRQVCDQYASRYAGKSP